MCALRRFMQLSGAKSFPIGPRKFADASAADWALNSLYGDHAISKAIWATPFGSGSSSRAPSW